MKLGKYRHYKGKEYELIGVGRHSDTLEEFVVYKALYNSDEFGDNAIWVKSKKMFEENVIINDKKEKRFKYIG